MSVLFSRRNHFILPLGFVIFLCLLVCYLIFLLSGQKLISKILGQRLLVHRVVGLEGGALLLGELAAEEQDL